MPPRHCLLYGHCPRIPRHRVSRNLPIVLDDPVRDLAAGGAAIHPSPAADVRLSIVLEQVIQALFQHEPTAACACHEDLLSMGFGSLSPSTGSSPAVAIIGLLPSYLHLLEHLDAVRAWHRPFQTS